MSLPNPGIVIVPFTQGSAEVMNDIIENIEALAAGTGLDDGVIKSSKFAAENEAYIAFAPSGNLDSDATGSFTTWATIGNITVPSWATKARITGAIVGAEGISSTANTNFRLVIGSDNGRTVNFSSDSGSDHSFPIVDEITLTGTGTKSLVVQSQRTNGTGAVRLATTSDLTFIIRFWP